MKISQDSKLEKENPLPQIGYGRRGRPRKNRERELLELISLELGFKEIQERTGLKRSSLYTYISRLRRKYNVQKFDKNFDKNRYVLICRECGGQIRKVADETSELVCTSCGLVTPTLNMAGRIPFGSSFALTSEMAFNRSLGSEPARGKRGYYQILAKATAGTQDLGIRAQKIRTIDTHVDPPQTRKLLEWGSLLLKDLGLYSKEYSQASHILGEVYGALLRKVGTWHFLSKVKVQNYKRLATATLYVVLDRFPDLAESLAQQPEKMDLLYVWRAEDLKLVLDILSIGKTEKEG